MRRISVGRLYAVPPAADRDVSAALDEFARAFIGRLDPGVQETFAYRNTDRLFGEG
ncbi:MAG: hypothetical protein HY678_05535 [Chloroflexi bacterium]|nr:hypothetical protein [Chloroflexota bacterium]